MNNFFLEKTKRFLLKKFNLIPQFAIITGSGIKLFQGKKPAFEIKYSKLPISYGKALGTKIKGHEGKLKLYKINKKGVLVFSGRRHLYETLDISQVTMNVKLAYELGVRKILITNAAGGINAKLKAGDLMLIKGFIDLMQPTERGLLNSITQKPCKIKSKISSHLKFKRGIYAGCLGPSYETHTEIKLLKMLGADAVGMSTVPEILCAKSLGMDYAAISIISNVWNKEHIPSHHDVLKNVQRANKKLDRLVKGLLR